MLQNKVSNGKPNKLKTKKSDTIAAIATKLGKSGIGIIRISGSDTLLIVSKFISSKLDILSFEKSKKRKLIFANIIWDGKKIDEILLAYFPDKKSFSGEISVELHCHGGIAVISSVLEIVLKSGARLANPGEFTQRAFKNGRINLIQAEAINDLINARNKESIKKIWRQMEGGLTARCIELKKKLFDLLVEIQSEIDFEIDFNHTKWVENLKDVYNIIDNIVVHNEKNRYFNHGCWIVISGPPNVGKSSIFNAILNMERSIVSDIPGTTRDHISETIEIEGMMVRLTDTAGIRETGDIIENISIERSKQQVLSADIIIYVLDQSNELKNINIKELENVLLKNGIIIFNKSDLKMHSTVKEYINNNNNNKNIFFVSILKNTGIEEVLNKICEIINNNFDDENCLIINHRQKALMEKSKESILSALKYIENKNIDLVMYELNNIINNVKETIGEITNEDVLDKIFSKFCVGK